LNQFHTIEFDRLAYHIAQWRDRGFDLMVFGVRRHVAAFSLGDMSPRGSLPTARLKQKACVAVQPYKSSPMNWPHAPKHWLFEPGIYMVTAGTYEKLHHLNSSARLDMFLESLFRYAEEFGWQLRAWAILANHYHFLAASPSDPQTLQKFLGKLHMKTAQELNRQDATPGRKVWFQFRDSHITFERSYLARLHYIHYNPAKHGVTNLAENYKWCSASWFSRNASPAFLATIKSFKTDQLDIADDY
jgi:putative transposase